MKNQNNTGRACILLEDGTFYVGRSVGATGTVKGEICFDTQMTGYQEMLTDPSYAGKILISTFVYVGNYGCNDSEDESEGIKVSGLVCRNFNSFYSRKQSSGSLQSYLEESRTVGISDVDTRALVRKLRDSGTMKAIISSEIFDAGELKKRLGESDPVDTEKVLDNISSDNVYIAGEMDAPYRVALLDFGVKNSLIRSLTEKGCCVKVFPAETSEDEVYQWNPDGVVLAGGPENSSRLPKGIEWANRLLKKGSPAYGTGLGHLFLAEAAGLEVFKMKHGHRGMNHPVLNKTTGLAEVTSQNHGQAVSLESSDKFSESVEVTHVNLNDNTVEGLRFKGLPIFSVQFDPEVSVQSKVSRNPIDIFIHDIITFKEKI